MSDESKIAAVEVEEIDAAPVAPVAGEAVAWLKEDGSDAWTDQKKRNAAQHNGAPGARIAETYSVPLFRHAAPQACAPVAGKPVAWEDVRDALAMFLSGATGKASKHWLAPLDDATASGPLAEMRACLSTPLAGVLVADRHVTFEAWAEHKGLIQKSHGIMSIDSQCAVAREAWHAGRAALARAPVAGGVVAWAAVPSRGKRAGRIYSTCDTREEIDAYIDQVHQSNDSLTLYARPLSFTDADS